ncbi:hypothetical protein Rhe02_05220 [Rhizocola hellebori]|uniref:Putative zinc-finger domain-containing protein n=1 Tax=Rhizocola hellebori TaxID=1392758 RepID=A0A8J3VD76_9ACTN|nr:zf-HC2 domain-containing protein [Rhizocola hellebori]GIH02455.1 hypothetical protein Rhe02_05220 [Rhizocola hellebori]
MSPHVAELLGAWALDACDDAEAATVEAHLEQCSDCRTEAAQLRSAAGWLALEQAMKPPPRLRQSILDEARRRRPPVAVRTLVEAYAGQVASLDSALRELTAQGWRRPDPRHGDMTGLIRHLYANDALLASDLALPLAATVPGDGAGGVYQVWRDQAQILIRGLDDRADLDQIVTLVGRDRHQPGPLRAALVQRAFETWVHLEDVRSLAITPSPEQVRRIVSLAVNLMPEALAARGVSRPGSCRLVLTGPASGEWTFPLGGQGTASGLALGMEASAFARLVANRRSPEALQYTVVGDHDLARRVLHVAALLGCD